MRPVHSSFTERANRSAKAFKLGDRGGSRIDSIRSRVSDARNVAEYFVSRSMIKKRVCRRNGSSASVRLRPSASSTPVLMSGDTRNLYRAARQIENKWNIVRYQSAHSEDFDREEVRGRDTRPMRL